MSELGIVPLSTSGSWTQINDTLRAVYTRDYDGFFIEIIENSANSHTLSATATEIRISLDRPSANWNLFPGASLIPWAHEHVIYRRVGHTEQFPVVDQVDAGDVRRCLSPNPQRRDRVTTTCKLGDIGDCAFA